MILELRKAPNFHVIDFLAKHSQLLLNETRAAYQASKDKTKHKDHSVRILKFVLNADKTCVMVMQSGGTYVDLSGQSAVIPLIESEVHFELSDEAFEIASKLTVPPEALEPMKGPSDPSAFLKRGARSNEPSKKSETPKRGRRGRQ